MTKFRELVQRILVVEDEPVIARAIERSLSEKGYLVEVAYDGEMGFELLREQDFDLIVLDAILPKMNGLDLCRKIRQDGRRNLPILMVTALGSTDNIVRGLEYGADDYMTKPFKMAELTARIRALLRRSSNQQVTRESVLRIADLSLNADTRKASRAGVEISLTATEYRLLECFIRNNGRVLSRLDLLESVWGVNYKMDTNVVDVYVNYLRKKIDKPFDTPLIHTVIGMGYILKGT